MLPSLEHRRLVTAKKRAFAMDRRSRRRVNSPEEGPRIVARVRSLENTLQRVILQGGRQS